MKLLKKIFKGLELNLNSRLKAIPRFSLCCPNVKVNHDNQKPYFSTRLIINAHGEGDDKLYIDDLKSNHQFYKESFNDNDWNIIQYNLGALDALQIANNYKLIEIDYENMQIKMINKSNGEKQKIDVAEIILTKQYMNFDKQSIFELATFFQTCKSSDVVQSQIKKLTKTSKSLKLKENDDVNHNTDVYIKSSANQDSLPSYLKVIK
jgi:hypothetical protein